MCLFAHCATSPTFIDWLVFVLIATILLKGGCTVISYRGWSADGMVYLTISHHEWTKVALQFIYIYQFTTIDPYRKQHVPFFSAQIRLACNPNQMYHLWIVFFLSFSSVDWCAGLAFPLCSFPLEGFNFSPHNNSYTFLFTQPCKTKPVRDTIGMLHKIANPNDRAVVARAFTFIGPTQQCNNYYY